MAAKKHGLGRGLDALIQRSIPEQKPEEEKNDAAEEALSQSANRVEGPLRKRIKGRSRRMKTV